MSNFAFPIMFSNGHTMAPHIVVAAVLLAQAYGYTMDPINNMCERFWHQSIVKNNVLYIDGGMQSFVEYNSTGNQVGNVTMGYNEHLIVIPLNQSWTLGTTWNNSNITEVALTKSPAPGVDSAIPNLVLGTLFEGPPDDDNIWLYGGTTSWWATDFPGFQWPMPDNYTLWGYSTTNQTWTKHSVQPEVESRPSAGMYAEAPELGLGFYFNGEVDSGSSTGNQVLNTTDLFMEGMVVVNLTDQTARNISTAALTGGLPRTRGILQYISGIGSKGILVTIGGTYKSYQDTTSDEQDNFVSMNEIGVFDVASLFDSNTSAPATAWYNQTASGATPAPRAQFCAVDVTAPDNSSYNIYIVSGNMQSTNSFYDDVYILSLPSFTWTQAYQGSSPRYGHTCHRASNRQMLKVGGALPGYFDGNISCDPQTHGVAVLDMTAMMYMDNYTIYDEPWQVPNSLVNTIGGNLNGGATLQQPINGYSDLALATLMGNPSAYKTPASNSTSSTTSSSSTNHTSHTGAIAGGVVGGIVGLALLAALLFFYVRSQNKKRRRAAATTAQQESERPMMAQAHSDFDGSGAALDSTASPRSELHTDAGPYGGAYYQHYPQELGTKDAVAYNQAELDGKQAAAQLPGGEHDGAAELQGTGPQVHELGGVRHSYPPVERYELPGSERL